MKEFCRRPTDCRRGDPEADKENEAGESIRYQYHYEPRTFSPTSELTGRREIIQPFAAPSLMRNTLPPLGSNELLGDSLRGRAHGGSCSKMTEKQTIAIDVLDHEASEAIIIVP
jgi:hypothetical protein